MRKVMPNIKSPDLLLFRQKLNCGFSLVEMLIVVLVFSIVSILVTQSIAISIRNSKKSESVGKVKENVEYAMNVVERSLRGARKFRNCIGIPTNRLDYTDEFGMSAYFSCQNYYIASGSARLTSSDVRITNCPEMFTCFEKEGKVPYSVNVSVEAEFSNLRGVEGAKYQAMTKILLR